MAISERRRFSRVGFDAVVELTQGTQTWTAKLVDISLKGLLLTQPSTFEISKDEPVQVKIVLSDKTPITMNAEIVHQSALQLGLACSLIDLDSISHLRRLIELNLGDPAAAERELSELIDSSTR